MMLKTDGSLWMVGFDGGGQLGDGGNINRKTPFPLRSGICAISAGSFHSLILDETAKLWAFGYNGSGQLGSGDTPDLSSYARVARSEEHTSELQSLMRISYAVFCLKKKKKQQKKKTKN